MTKDELMLAFRMIAMGRPSTPHVEGLADFLLSLIPGASMLEQPAMPEVLPVALEVELPDAPTAEEVEAHKEAKEAKRGPGRPKKAS